VGVALVLAPLEEQVTALVEMGKYEEALRYCGTVTDERAAANLDLEAIHEKYGFLLVSRGSFRKVGVFSSTSLHLSCISLAL